MPTQAEKLHTLNILAKKLRDSRITLKEYLFGFQKSKDSDFFNDYPSLSKNMEEFINLTKKLVSVIDLIPRDCISEIYDLFRISKLTVSDLYIDYEGKRLGLFSLKNLYEKKKFYNSDFSDSFERYIVCFVFYIKEEISVVNSSLVKEAVVSELEPNTTPIGDDDYYFSSLILRNL